MKLFRMTKKIRNEEDGAVTVDWVVLTAAIVGLGVAVITLIGKKVYTAGNDTATSVGDSTSIDFGQGTGGNG
ncbi:pilus assembly protein [Thioclava sp. GXIMD2076]|uniref:pilus assembly protein n=1 Tax=Thioclava sp. GXIMD2076 TaxID=3131931 RepID=UPI0030D208AE